MESEGKVRMNNYINPECGLADTEENDALETQDQVQLCTRGSKERKRKVTKQTP